MVLQFKENAGNVRCGTFAGTQYSLGQEIGRVEVLNNQQGVVGTVHAIRVPPNSILGTIFKISGVGFLLIKMLYGSYTWRTIGEETFLISEKSVQVFVLQRMALAYLQVFKNTALYDGDVKTKVDSLYRKFLDDKAPFRELTRSPHLPYKEQLDQFVLEIDGDKLQVMLNNGQVGISTQAITTYRMVNITEQKMARFCIHNSSMQIEKVYDDNSDFAYFE